MELKALVSLSQTKTHTAFGRGNRSNQGACVCLCSTTPPPPGKANPLFLSLLCCWQSLRTFTEVRLDFTSTSLSGEDANLSSP